MAYRNPFTGDYCVAKSREPQGFVNAPPESPDSGLSDEYEPLHLEPCAQVNLPDGSDLDKLVRVSLISVYACLCLISSSFHWNLAFEDIL